jgi:hypothetical protein
MTVDVTRLEEFKQQQLALIHAQSELEWLRGWGKNFSEVVESQATHGLELVAAAQRGEVTEPPGEGKWIAYHSVYPQVQRGWRRRLKEKISARTRGATPSGIPDGHPHLARNMYASHNPGGSHDGTAA